MLANDLISRIQLNYQPICIFAHPGHELAILNILSKLNPIVHILTDGSGHTQRSRIPYTDAVIEKINASKGEVWGAYTDIEAYNLLSNLEDMQFIELYQKLLAYVRNFPRVCIISDALEGYNPIHDLAAVFSQFIGFYLRMTGKDVINISFSPILASEKHLAPNPYNHNLISIQFPLSIQSLDRKMSVAHEYLPLRDEIKVISNTRDLTSEVLYWHHPCTNLSAPSLSWHPLWESYSKDRVKKGIYEKTLTYSENFLPIFNYLSTIIF